MLPALSSHALMLCLHATCSPLGSLHNVVLLWQAETLKSYRLLVNPE